MIYHPTHCVNFLLRFLLAPSLFDPSYPGSLESILHQQHQPDHERVGHLTQNHAKSIEATGNHWEVFELWVHAKSLEATGSHWEARDCLRRTL